MDNLNVINIFDVGSNDNCEHRWVYKMEKVLLFVYPPNYLNQRICEECGRIELVKSDYVIKCENDKFCTVKDKFNGVAKIEDVTK